MSNRLKMERIGAKKTLDDVAEILGISRHTASVLESDDGNKNLKAPQLIILAETYGCTVEWLLGLSETRSKQ